MKKGKKKIILILILVLLIGICLQVFTIKYQHSKDIINICKKIINNKSETAQCIKRIKDKDIELLEDQIKYKESKKECLRYSTTNHFINCIKGNIYNEKKIKSTDIFLNKFELYKEAIISIEKRVINFCLEEKAVKKLKDLLICIDIIEHSNDILVADFLKVPRKSILLVCKNKSKECFKKEKKNKEIVEDLEKHTPYTIRKRCYSNNTYTEIAFCNRMELNNYNINKYNQKYNKLNAHYNNK